jgi:NDP-sugar pyrophosphorylase family protein
MIVNYLKANANFGMHIEVSREETLLDTGGGLKKAAHFFTADSGSLESSFLLHNVDVISTIDLGRMVRFHTETQALATLAVQNRKSARYLLFDERLQLCGRRFVPDQEDQLAGSPQQVQALAFSGIHVISSRFLGMMTEEGAFSIITSYLNLAANNERILAFKTDESYWRDLGKLRDLEQAAQDLKDKVIL